MPPHTSIVVVTYNHASLIVDCVRALERAGLDPAQTRLYLVDNASADGSAEVIRREVLDESGTATRGGLPAELIANASNLGFAGGNNLAIARALAAGDDFVYLLNPDTEVELGFLAEALEVAREDPRIALVQSLLLRHAEPDVVNTFGNALHFLGFGYAAGDGQRLDDPAVADRLSQPREIAYASGAGVLVRASVLAEIGPFNEELFAYHEDLELSWRARLASYRVMLAPHSRVRHKYEFSKSTRKFYFMERNRFLVLSWYYRPATLLLLAPALLAMEAGTLAMSLRGGWWREKLGAYRYFLEPSRLPAVLATRARIQALRRQSDREVSERFTGEIVFPSLAPWALTHLANPAFAAYWAGVRRLLRW